MRMQGTWTWQQEGTLQFSSVERDLRAGRVAGATSQDACAGGICLDIFLGPGYDAGVSARTHRRTPPSGDCVGGAWGRSCEPACGTRAQSS